MQYHYLVGWLSLLSLETLLKLPPGLMDDVLSLGGAVRGWDGWVSHEDFELLKKKLLL